MKDIIISMLTVVAIGINSITWYNYKKNIKKKAQRKEGWNNLYLLSTIILIIYLISKLSDLSIIT